MKEQHFVTNMILTFWFGWFAIAGIAITALINWIFSMNFNREDMLVAGAIIGIMSGGVAALVFFIIGKKKKLAGFGQHLHGFKSFQGSRK
jgi:hypothetical protein